VRSADPSLASQSELLETRSIMDDIPNLARESERRARSIIDGIPGLVATLGPDGVVEAVNRQIHEYTGLALEDLRHWPDNGIVHPEDAARTSQLFAGSIARGIPFHIEQRLRRHDGVYRWFGMRGTPAREASGQIARWYVLLTDTQERRQAEETLEKLRSEIARLSRISSLGLLTASIAHEVSQPLSGILTNANTCLRMLAAGPPNIEGALETARRIVRDANRASEVVARLRALFQKKTQRTESVDLSEAAIEVVALASGDLQRNQVRLRLDCARGLPKLDADRVQLQQVILNLLLNGCDAMSAVAGRPRTLRLTTARDGNSLRLSVTDAGIGFAAEDAEQLFEAFYTKKNDGMGIGLSVSREIIERHDGRMWGEPNQGPGATFSFTIPIASHEARTITGPRYQGPMCSGPNGAHLASVKGPHQRACGEEKPIMEAKAIDDGAAIRPFQVKFSDTELAEMRRRIAATRWPERETVDDDSQGVRLALIQEVARYWATEYDWRRCEAKLNAVPQFITEIDGLPIHFIHVRSKHENALPLIVTHGWPGSILEQLKIIEPLTNPTAHGGSAADAFHLVIPSIPGYGFSGKPSSSGWDPSRIARAWTTLMKRLGYSRFVAQGGDWGAMISEVMAKQAPEGLLGIHLNLQMVVPPDVVGAAHSGSPTPPGLSPDEQRAYEQVKHFLHTGVAYALEMGTRPQTLYGISDSPVGLAAWLIDHGDGDAQPAAAITKALLTKKAASADELTRDDVLDNITLFWLTNTGVSSGRIYWENKFSLLAPKGIQIPVAVSVFPGELFQAPESWSRRAYGQLIYFNKAQKGGHFAAWEQPQLFANEVRAGFRSLRT
jgi:PAS domain S-box-containing protein